MILIQHNRKGGENLDSICKWYWNAIEAKLKEKINNSESNNNCNQLNTCKIDCKEFFLNNLEKLITGKPEQLIEIYDEWIKDYCTNQQGDSLISIYKLAVKKKKKERNNSENDIISFLKSFLQIFDYDKLFTKSIKYQLAQKLNVNVCPYCNRNYTFTIQKRKTKSSTSINTRPDYDHFFSKSIHPILALSFYNLIPSCSICNRTLKGDAEFSLEGNIHPYLEGFPKEAKFTYDPNSVNQALGIDDGCKIKLEYDKKNIKVENNDKTFGLNAIYSEHGDIAAEVITKFHKTNGHYVQTLTTQFRDLSEDELYRIAFGNYYNESDFEKRPMAKLTKDIYEELKFINPYSIE